MLPLHTHAIISPGFPTRALKVLDLAEALEMRVPLDRVVVRLVSGGPSVDLDTFASLGVAALWTDQPIIRSPLPVAHSLRNPAVVAAGDVVCVRPSSGQVSVLYRRSANANSLFVTEQCNSLCLMCSQPPREAPDGWRVTQIFDYLPLIDRSLPQLGITGGEPTLLGDGLGELLRACRRSLPETRLHILTNGRRFAAQALVEVSDALGIATWGIPVYADTASRHDFVVQAQGAFEETLHGLFNLAEHKHSIEVRCVLHRETVPRLKQLARFISRTLPFVDHIALMGLEPMGFARVNRDILWVDPADYAQDLADATLFLAQRGLNVSIYNTPLCLLPRAIWPFARRSISDWKQDYAAECEGCAQRAECGGFFMSAGPAWKSRAVKAITSLEAVS